MAQKIYIYGKHAVGEALTHAPNVVLKVHLAANMDDAKLRAAIRAAGVPTEKLDPKRVSSMVEHNAPHQGVVALVSLGNVTVPFEHFVGTLNVTDDTLLILLSEVQDPHNVGAIIRSAAALGASAVLMPAQKQSPITGAVIKASVGMAFHIPLVVMQNMQQGIAELKKKGMRVYGLDTKGSPLSEEEFSGATLFVLGNESQGVAPAARALCDATLSIPMRAGVESLNVAASAAVAFYAWNLSKSRKF
ncbi:MAG: 23S rRNA (guanosine(2251)-2'-O)-methyltransferase RlmB [Patescibacteria group bacterium]|nr:23S rRNA (guanosine(2251)-2'-O)-methyltransferase RlmB [Patescibacteria group bacterium]